MQENMTLSAMPAFGSFMAAKPKARLLVASGYYDMTIPLGNSQYSFAHSGVPADRVTFRNYQSGHTISDDAAARLLLLHDIRTFMAARSPS